MAIDYGSLARGRDVNYWSIDPVVQSEVDRTVPTEDRSAVVSNLESFGELIGTTVADNADVVDANGPVLHTYDRDGQLVNEVEYHPAQIENERAVYESGVVADSFRPPSDGDERLPLLQNLAMDYLLSYADIGLTCPVAMTAGAALVLESFDDGRHDRYLEGLLSRDYDDLLQGAMFLTERQAGSDVGAIETVAEPVDDDVYRLSGEKWFCSNIDAGVILTLASRPGAPAGTAGLSMFLVPRTTRAGQRNHFVAKRLKDKLGTVSVPTGEVEFDDTEAYLVGEADRGFRYMARMLNFERLSNAFAACGATGRALLESKVRAADRETFGQRLDRHPLMRRDLLELSVAHEAATTFTFDAGLAFERAITADDRPSFQLMRALVPVAKHRTARLAVRIASYAMEIQGGNGYVADWVTHRLLRDAQVLPIWEGPSNVLALDLLRAMDRESAHLAVADRIVELLDEVDHSVLDALEQRVRSAFDTLEADARAVANGSAETAQYHAKALADTLYSVYTSARLLEIAQGQLEAGSGRKALVARQFIRAELQASESAVEPPAVGLNDDWFDAIVRFEPIDAADLEALTPAVE